MFCFSPENAVRRFLSHIVIHTHFESFIFSIVVISCLLISLEAPLSDPNSTFNEMLRLINDVITGFFTIESIFKAIVWGFMCNGPDSYLRHGWNILDFFIVLSSLAGLGLDLDFTSLKVNDAFVQNLELLKMLRVLRSMRLFTSIEGLRLCVLSIINSLPGIFNVAVVTFLFFILFGIFFLNLFKGSFHYCDMTKEMKNQIDFGEIIRTKFDCINHGGRWKNTEIHFDSLGDSVLSLFILATGEGVVPFMI